MKGPSGWIQGIQYFRAIAIIEVIILHATLVSTKTDLTTITPQKAILIAFMALTTFAVPCFIFISGFVLYNKYVDRFSYSAFYKKRLTAVVPPYLIWSAFYFFYPFAGAALYTAVFHHQTYQYGSIPSAVQLISGYLTGLVVGIWQMWFIVLLIQLYLLYPFLARLYNSFTRRQSPIYLLALLLFVQVGYVSFFISRSGADPVIYTSHPFCLPAIFYFVFGIFLSDHYETTKPSIARFNLIGVTATVVLATICYSFLFYQTCLLPNTISLYYWLFQITGPFYWVLLVVFYLRICDSWGSPSGFFKGSLEKIGEDSFGIYLVHLFFMTAFTFTLPALGLSINNLLFYLAAVSLTLACSYGVVQVIYRLPAHKLIIGERRKKGVEIIGIVREHESVEQKAA